MENETCEKQALNAAYGFLARRAHSCLELKKKLAGKGFSRDIAENITDKLCRQGYLNDMEVSLSWAVSLIRNKRWGKAKVAFYLQQKGISTDIISHVQDKIWQEISEEDVARKALAKHFASTENLLYGKAGMFLKSRGFSSDVIYSVIADLSEDKGL